MIRCDSRANAIQVGLRVKLPSWTVEPDDPQEPKPPPDNLEDVNRQHGDLSRRPAIAPRPARLGLAELALGALRAEHWQTVEKSYASRAARPSIWAAQARPGGRGGKPQSESSQSIATKISRLPRRHARVAPVFPSDCSQALGPNPLARVTPEGETSSFSAVCVGELLSAVHKGVELSHRLITDGDTADTRTEDLYAGGSYLERNPTWHVEDSPWKAQQVLRMLDRHDLAPRTIAEVGCGAGEILKQLEQSLPYASLVGYEISPKAIELAQPRASKRLRFELKDILKEDVRYDLVLLIDVIEHVENPFSFLRRIRERSEHTVLHIPLDISVQSVLKGTLLEKRADLGHIHYFTKELALTTLGDVGYEVVDHFYTFHAVELPAKSWRQQFRRVTRHLAFSASPDIAVRVLGGASLLVLAR
jgi:hypothetical protein